MWPNFVAHFASQFDYLRGSTRSVVACCLDNRPAATGAFVRENKQETTTAKPAARDSQAAQLRQIEHWIPSFNEQELHSLMGMATRALESKSTVEHDWKWLEELRRRRARFALQTTL